MAEERNKDEVKQTFALKGPSNLEREGEETRGEGRGGERGKGEETGRGEEREGDRGEGERKLGEQGA